MTFSKKSVVFVFAQVTVFTAIILLFSWLDKTVPAELIVSFFAWFGLEGGALAVLKIDERKKKSHLNAIAFLDWLENLLSPTKETTDEGNID